MLLQLNCNEMARMDQNVMLMWLNRSLTIYTTLQFLDIYKYRLCVFQLKKNNNKVKSFHPVSNLRAL